MTESEFRPNMADTESEYRPNMSDTESEYRPNMADTESEYRPNMADTESEFRPNMADSESEYRPNMADTESEFRPNMADTESEYRPNTADTESEYRPNMADTESEYRPNTADTSEYTPNTADVAEEESLPPVPPMSLQLSNKKRKKKVLSAPPLSLSLGGESLVSEDLSLVLSPSGDEVDLDLDLEGLETPSDSESLMFPPDLDLDLDLEEDMRRLGVACSRGPAPSSGPTPSRSLDDTVDTVDSAGSRWRSFSCSGASVNMSLIQDHVRVLSHGGYYSDEQNDIIVFSSCYLPENNTESYEEVMDHLFRYVMGTLELMVSQDYVIIYLCAGAQRNQLPGLSWLRDCYTAIDRRLRKNLKSFFVVHPTWFIKALITIVKPFISSKFSRKLVFVDSLQQLSDLVPTEHAQIPNCVTMFDQSLS